MKNIVLAQCALALCLACQDKPAPLAGPVAQVPVAAEVATPGQAVPTHARLPEREVAVFRVEGLTDEVTGTLVEAIAQEKGVISARGDKEAQTLSVTFEPGVAVLGDLATKMSATGTKVTFDKVIAADPQAEPKHDCGSCPMRSSCGGEH